MCVLQMCGREAFTSSRQKHMWWHCSMLVIQSPECVYEMCGGHYWLVGAVITFAGVVDSIVHLHGRAHTNSVSDAGRNGYWCGCRVGREKFPSCNE